VVRNALSFDFEEYFQVHGFEDRIDREWWASHESRLRPPTEKTLAWLAERNIKATFFVLGWNVERAAGLLKDISAQGHEVASHGWEHKLVYNQSRDEFYRDIERAKKALEDKTGQAVLGYRAPSYSIRRDSLWALEEIARAGYSYDSSIYPVRRRRYGIPDAPRFPHRISVGERELIEFPLPTLRFASFNIPVATGAYLRLLPFSLSCYGISRLNKMGMPAMVNIHTWELDPGQPSVKVDVVRRFFHYHRLGAVEGMLKKLVERFRFTSARECLEDMGYLR